MKKILLISTGGTFNKIYNPLNGNLEIDSELKALDEISTKWQIDFEAISLIDKDSLEVTNSDRLLLLATINLSTHNDIIVIHGTDTMDLSAEYMAEAELEKRIIFTGSMVPYSIDPIEATANLSAALGYLQALEKEGVYISMNGIVAPYDTLIKDRVSGKFVLRESK
ncbi:MAG: asparaginase domain-containing protein [Campylobacterota bacterium]|nr:asparaginase domain-containing protein [Campylobacterota bacterium]